MAPPEGLLVVGLGRRLLQSALVPSLPLLFHHGALLRQFLCDQLRQVGANAERPAGLHAGVEVLVGPGLRIVATAHAVAPLLFREMDLSSGKLAGRERATLALVIAEELLDHPARSFMKSDSSIRHLELADAHPLGVPSCRHTAVLLDEAAGPPKGGQAVHRRVRPADVLDEGDHLRELPVALPGHVVAKWQNTHVRSRRSCRRR